MTKIFTHHPIALHELESETTERGRVYFTPDGKKYPSVTTVLALHTKAGVSAWRERVGEEEANRISSLSAERGTAFHERVEKYLNNELTENIAVPSYTDKEYFQWLLFDSAKPLLDRIDDIYAQEKTLYSHHLRMAGRVDCIAKYDGKRSVIDFKTSGHEKDVDHIQHYFMQGAAYAIMYEELTRVPITNIVIIVAVESGMTQVFKAKRDDYVSNLLFYRDLYEHINKRAS